MLLTPVKALTPVYTTLWLPNAPSLSCCAFILKVVVIAKMPNEGIIDGFKGAVDFYFYMGIPVARAWPKSPGKNRSEPVKAQWPFFTYASKEWKHLSPAMQAAYNQIATNSGLSGRDMQVRSYLTGLYRYPIP